MSLYSATVSKPNWRNLPQAQITPQIINASVNCASTDAYMGEGSYIAVGSTGPVTITITDGNGNTMGNAWSVPANNTLYFTSSVGAWLPNGFNVSCVGSGCSTTEVYMSWYTAR